MTHASNERIAKSLRALADRIENSLDEFHGSLNTYGGRPKFITVNLADDGGPASFMPVCFSLLLGDKGFIDSHAVIETSLGG